MTKRKVRSAFFIYLSLTLMLSAFVVFSNSSQVAYASNTTYYVNNQTGSNCSNTGAGTSTAAPWCDFTPINSHGAFGPGDQILLARGATWNQEMDLTGAGTSTNYITLDAYGTGAMPKINRSRGVNDRTIYMTDPSFWKIQNLEISNAAQGIEVDANSLGDQGIIFSNLYIHDIDLILTGSPANSIGVYNSTAIIFGGSAPSPGSGQWWFKDIDINHVTTSNTDPFSATAVDGYPTTTFQGIRIHDNNITNVPGDMAFQESSNVKVYSNYIDSCAIKPQPQGTTCIFFWRTQDITFSNNVIKNVPNTNSTDQCIVDHEAYNDSDRFRSNYLAGAAGAGLEYLHLGGRSGDFSTNHEVSDNAFSNNGGSSMTESGKTTFTGTASNNLYYEPKGFLSSANPFSSWTLTNNSSITSAANLFNAGNDFSGTQGTNGWSYQLYNGTSYSNLTYDSTNQWWGSSTGFVSRFGELPNSTSSNWVARAWTASSTGTISIRGRIHKDDIGGGDGVTAKITKNGTIIWPTNGTPQSIAYNDDVGVATDLDSISVAAGDIIRFEVNNGGSANSVNDLTSWSPSVAYR